MDRKIDIAKFQTGRENHIVHAWLSHSAGHKAYILHVYPVEVVEYGNGIVIHKVVLYSGRAVHIDYAPRYSAKRLERLAADAEMLARAKALATTLGAIVEV